MKEQQGELLCKNSGANSLPIKGGAHSKGILIKTTSQGGAHSRGALFRGAGGALSRNYGKLVS